MKDNIRTPLKAFIYDNFGEKDGAKVHSFYSTLTPPKRAFGHGSGSKYNSKSELRLKNIMTLFEKYGKDAILESIDTLESRISLGLVSDSGNLMGYFSSIVESTYKSAKNKKPSKVEGAKIEPIESKEAMVHSYIPVPYEHICDTYSDPIKNWSFKCPKCDKIVTIDTVICDCDAYLDWFGVDKNKLK